MLQADALVPADAGAPRLSAERRLAWGLSISLLFHALMLSLQFGVPGMALQGARSAIDITLARVLPPVPTPPEPAVPDPVVAETPVAPTAPGSGMRLVDPVPRPVPAPPRPKAVRKDRPRKAPRVSTPLPRPEADTPTRVIAQASNPDSEFVVPLPQPEEAAQKTIDPVEAQHGSDELAEAAQEEAPLPELQLPTLARTDAAAEDLNKAADEERLAAATAREQAALARQRLAQALAERQQQEQLAQQRLALELAERRKADELLAQQRSAQEIVERQKAEERVAQQRRDAELAERQKTEELLARQRLAQEQAERQRLAQEQAERQRLEELAARKLADDRARQDAARAREAAVASTAAPAGDPFGAPDGQGGGGRTRSPPGNYGSDLANRVRDLSKGLDLLTGAPPARPRPDDARQSRRVVVDSAERDVPLRMYVESWRQKIERNGGMNFPKLIAERARIDPLVSVAVRSDGSIEDVTIVRSSGRQDTDDAVRRIVRINALYSRFPPNIAARYDVIEIRRIWTFDQVLKLIEEVR